MTTPEPRAVFISYSSDDVEAAQRIASALTEAGLEVWFDRSELRGGDAWDQNIRRQIRECALFLPIVSATTERRPEGYFRLEWRIADQRTHHMGRTKAFLVPVCIDDVNQDIADVPDSFLAVHWTRLPSGQATPEFVDRVSALLKGSTTPDGGRARPPFPVQPVRPVASPPVRAPVNRRYAVLAGIIALVAAGAVGLSVWYNSRAEPEKSIAVRPFDDFTPDAQASTFVDGIQADLATKLALVKEFRVISRTSMTQYRNSTKSSSQIAEEQAVSYILEGNARRTGNKVRLTAQLIDARTNAPILTKEFPEQDIADLFDTQAALVQAIAERLSVTLSDAERAQIGTKPTSSQSAYEIYQTVELELKSEPQTRAWLDQQEKRLIGVIGSDENFKGAWALLAIIHSRQIGNRFDTSEARLGRAKDAIDTANRLVEPGAVVPEIVRSWGIYYDQALHDYAKAAEQFQVLARLQPLNADPYGYLGGVRIREGKWDEARQNLSRASQTDQDNLLHARTLESLLIGGRRFVEARQVRLQILRTRNTPAENYQLALLEFLSSGSTQIGSRYFKALPADQLDSPEILALQLNWARITGDLETAIRLDRVQIQAGKGEEDPDDTLNAAVTLIASGNLAAGRERLGEITANLRATLSKQPNNAKLLQYLGLAEALLGNSEEGLKAGKDAVKELPESVDASAAPVARASLAIIQAWNGDKAAVIAEIKALLQVPFFPGTIHTLKTDPWYFPLRGDAEFDALLANATNNQPIFTWPIDLRGGRGGRTIEPNRGGRVGADGGARTGFNPGEGGRQGGGGRGPGGGGRGVVPVVQPTPSGSRAGQN